MFLKRAASLRKGRFFVPYSTRVSLFHAFLYPPFQCYVKRLRDFRVSFLIWFNLHHISFQFCLDDVRLISSYYLWFLSNCRIRGRERFQAAAFSAASHRRDTHLVYVFFTYTCVSPEAWENTGPGSDVGSTALPIVDFSFLCFPVSATKTVSWVPTTPFCDLFR